MSEKCNMRAALALIRSNMLSARSHWQKRDLAARGAESLVAQ